MITSRFWSKALRRFRGVWDQLCDSGRADTALSDSNKENKAKWTVINMCPLFQPSGRITLILVQACSSGAWQAAGPDYAEAGICLGIAPGPSKQHDLPPTCARWLGWSASETPIKLIEPEEVAELSIAGKRFAATRTNLLDWWWLSFQEEQKAKSWNLAKKTIAFSLLKEDQKPRNNC